MSRSILFLFVTALLAADAQDDALKKEVEKFQGSWTAIAIEENGEALPAEQIKRAQEKITFTGDKYVQTAGGKIVEAGTQKLDPTKKPKTMDISVTDGDEKGKTQLAIYEIEGETLKICAGRHGSTERPKEFSTKSGGGVVLIVLKKDKAQ